MKSLGIIGGLGPMATAHLLRLIIEMTDAKTDQEHLDVIVFNRPAVPDRTAYLLDRTKPSPLPSMRETAQALEGLGVSYLCAPCVTSHYFYRELAESVAIPFLNMVEETAEELALAGKKRVGIMATTGTVSTQLFQKALAAKGLEAVIPNEKNQELTMSLIYGDVKAGRPPEAEKLRRVSGELFEKGCDSIILGCTELSVVKRDISLEPGFLDALEVLAKRCVQRCEAPLKAEYRQLFT